MPGWPSARLRTYLANDLPSIKSGDLDAIQDLIAQMFGARGGFGYWIWGSHFDDLGNTPYSSVNALIGNSPFFIHTNASTDVQVVHEDTPPLGKFGVASLTTVAGTGGDFIIKGPELNFASDLYISCQLRIKDRAVITTAEIGIEGQVNIHRNAAGTPHWQYAGNITDHDSGVVIVNDQWYLLEIERISGAWFFYIDGAHLHTGGAEALLTMPSRPYMKFHLTAPAGTTTYVQLDFYWLSMPTA